jgi:hypothetical protein
VVVRLEGELEEAKIEIDTLKAEDPAKYAWMHACDDLAKECVELKAELSTLRGLLREVSNGILNEIDAVLYFGFMICESADGRAEVRIKFADLRHAQRLHSALVAIRNGAALEGKP